MFGFGKKKKENEITALNDSENNWKGQISRLLEVQDGLKITWSFTLQNHLGKIYMVVIERAGGFGAYLRNGDVVEIKEDFHVKGNVIHAKKMYIESIGVTIEGKKYWPDPCKKFT